MIFSSQAQYRGTGTINGAGTYNFTLMARDGDMDGETNPDGFRMKIADSAGNTIYDNKLGISDDLGNTQVSSGGNIIIHSS